MPISRCFPHKVASYIVSSLLTVPSCYQLCCPFKIAGRIRSSVLAKLSGKKEQADKSRQKSQVKLMKSKVQPLGKLYVDAIHLL